MNLTCTERVILPLPRQAKRIREAADLFQQQYGSVLLEVDGHFCANHGVACQTAGWMQIAQLDFELDLIGLGAPEDDEEDLCWLVPCGPAYLRLSSMPPDSDTFR